MNVSQSGQLAMKTVLKNLLARVEWNDQGLATRLFPTTRENAETSTLEAKTIAIDPRISFGRPMIIGTGIPTLAIAERYEAGESPESIAHDLNCEPSQIHDAIRFELVLSRAA